MLTTNRPCIGVRTRGWKTLGSSLLSSHWFDYSLFIYFRLYFFNYYFISIIIKYILTWYILLCVEWDKRKLWTEFLYFATRWRSSSTQWDPTPWSEINGGGVLEKSAGGFTRSDVTLSLTWTEPLRGSVFVSGPSVRRSRKYYFKYICVCVCWCCCLTAGDLILN